MLHATLKHAGIDGVYFASTSAPYREKQVASVVATACDLPRRVQTADFAGSVRAGVSALLAAINAVRAGALKDVLVTAADTRMAAPESEIEGLLGDAAAAVRVGSGDVIAEVVDAASVSEEFTHLWRTDTERFLQAFPGRFSYTYGYARDLGEAIRALLTRQNLKPDAIAKLALSSPDARAAVDLAKELGFDPKRQLAPSVLSASGSAGVADPLLALASRLDDAAPGDLIIVGAYGEGADALLLRATDALPRRRAERSWKHWLDSKLPLPSYEKYLKFRRVVDVDEPGEAINNVLEFKELKQDVRLYGSRCEACGTGAVSRWRACASSAWRAIDCRTTSSRKQGTVFTFTVDHLIANLEHPLPMAVVDLDGGGRLYLQVTDFAEQEVDDRQARDAHLPPPARGRWQSQLLLEGAAAALKDAAMKDQVAVDRRRLHEVRRPLRDQLRGADLRGGVRGVRRRRDRSAGDPGGVSRHVSAGPVGREGGGVARRRAASVRSADHARRELLRHRHRRVPQRLPGDRVRRLRHRPGARRREAEGPRRSRPAAPRPSAAREGQLGARALRAGRQPLHAHASAWVARRSPRSR